MNVFAAVCQNHLEHFIEVETSNVRLLSQILFCRLPLSTVEKGIVRPSAYLTYYTPKVYKWFVINSCFKINSFFHINEYNILILSLNKISCNKVWSHFRVLQMKKINKLHVFYYMKIIKLEPENFRGRFSQSRKLVSC